VEERQTTREANVVRSALGWGDATIVVGHVGGMIGLRDQRTLLSAFASFNRRCPDSGLLLIGDGPLRRELEAFSGELGISGQVKFLGYKVEVGNFLRAMDIYVNPAYLEGFGIAVGEAMLARLPVVLANGGSHPELVVDGESGILYSPGDVGALLDVLEKLARNPASRFKLGESARSRALDIFSPAEIASRHVALLSDVIEETNRRRHKQQKVT
jgi:glycosyltransferase involved in cell wall biosynthesis